MLRRRGFLTSQLRVAWHALQLDIDDGRVTLDIADTVRTLLFGSGAQEFLGELPDATMPHQTRLHRPIYVDEAQREYFPRDSSLPLEETRDIVSLELPKCTNEWIVRVPPRVTYKSRSRALDSNADDTAAAACYSLPTVGEELVLTSTQGGGMIACVSVEYVSNQRDATAAITLDTEIPLLTMTNTLDVYERCVDIAMRKCRQRVTIAETQE
jgi:hypothetical protein